jgi:hypothetical protein
MRRRLGTVFHGLTPWELAIDVGLLAAILLMIIGAVGSIWPRRSPSGDVLVMDFFGKVKVKSNVMAIGVLTGGIVLLGGLLLAASKTTPHFSLTGKVVLDDGRSISGINVGLIPPEHSTDTSSTGTIRLEVPRPCGSGIGAYRAVVYYNDGKRLRAEIASVNIDGNWVATIDHRFGRQ